MCLVDLSEERKTEIWSLLDVRHERIHLFDVWRGEGRVGFVRQRDKIIHLHNQMLTSRKADASRKPGLWLKSDSPEENHELVSRPWMGQETD